MKSLLLRFLVLLAVFAALFAVWFFLVKGDGRAVPLGRIEFKRETLGRLGFSAPVPAGWDSQVYKDNRGEFRVIYLQPGSELLKEFKGVPAGGMLTKAGAGNALFISAAKYGLYDDIAQFHAKDSVFAPGGIYENRWSGLIKTQLDGTTAYEYAFEGNHYIDFISGGVLFTVYASSPDVGSEHAKLVHDVAAGIEPEES
jgi:hypothetical protein